MTTEKIIGIVGGAGPFAGLDLQAKILNQTVAGRDQDHLTIITLSQPNQLPDRTDYLLGNVPERPLLPSPVTLPTLQPSLMK